jgi:hypothetical protein
VQGIATIRTVDALTFVAILVFSFAASSVLVNTAKANWLWDLPDPTPEITIQTPKNQTTYFQNQLPLTVLTTVPFESSITMTYQVDQQAGGNMASSKTDGSEYSATLMSLSEGWHTVNVWAYGENPQGKSGIDTASVTFLVDVVAPVVSVLSPENKTYQTFDLPLNFTLSEKARWIGYSLDEQPPVTVSGNVTLAGLSEGVHSLKVYANDTVGREGSSEAVFFSVKQEPEEIVSNDPAPFPWLPVAAVSVVVAVVVAVAAVVYLKKRKPCKQAS